MKVLFAASECVPFVKTGGLGDVIGALPNELVRQGTDARVILPKYGMIDKKYTEKMKYIDHIYIKMGWRSQYCGVFELVENGVTYYFVDNEFYFGSDTIYSNMADDIERFVFFDKAVLALLQIIDFFPDVIHTNDWQTGLVSVLLDAHYKHDNRYRQIKTVYTIHNLKFQGIYDLDTIKDVSDLSDYYFTPDKLEFFSDANLMKGGIVYSNAVTTVSPTYAQEIQNSYFGEKLDGLLRARKNSLHGIINGVDYIEYNPRTDEAISEKFDARSFISRKKINKLALQQEIGLKQDENKFLIAMVGRLTSQKGLDLVECVLDNIISLGNVQVAILGTGDKRYEDKFHEFEWKYKGTVSSCVMFDQGRSHRFYAGADCFLMPSLFEPCGLSQMIAMRYGTIPIVRETGGLKDTVEPYNEYDNTGDGFSFKNYNAHEMLGIIEYAKSKYENDKKAWNGIIRRAMAKDFSWTNSAKKYIDLYKNI